MHDLRIFQLMDSLEAGRQAPAVLLAWDGVRYMPSETAIELFDFVGQHGQRGDRGYCALSPQSGLWEVVSGLYSQDARQVI